MNLLFTSQLAPVSATNLHSCDKPIKWLFAEAVSSCFTSTVYKIPCRASITPMELASFKNFKISSSIHLLSPTLSRSPSRRSNPAITKTCFGDTVFQLLLKVYLEITIAKTIRAEEVAANTRETCIGLILVGFWSISNQGAAAEQRNGFFKEVSEPALLNGPFEIVNSGIAMTCVAQNYLKFPTPIICSGGEPFDSPGTRDKGVQGARACTDMQQPYTC